MAKYPDHADNPHYRADIEALFEPQVRHICLMNNRLCPTGFMVFGYPDAGMFYDTFTEINEDEIPRVISVTQTRGFLLDRIHSRWNDEHPESSADSLLYRLDE